jgi:hypothetical protein
VRCEVADPKDNDPEALTVDTINPLANNNSAVNGYYVDANLKAFGEIKFDMSNEDFGITILMMYFAEFYSRNQYPLFVHTFQTILELEYIDRFLLSYSKRAIKLPMNMATDERYGLKAQSAKFTGVDCLPLRTFIMFETLMHSPVLTPELFIENLKSLHLKIIESLYMFTSIVRDCKVINECHELTYRSMPFTFQKLIPSLKYDGQYWFELPRKIIWFAYHMGKMKFTSYASKDVINLMDVFKKYNVNCVVQGYVHQNTVYPLIFDDPILLGYWERTITYIGTLNLISVFKNDEHIPCTSSNVCFVKQGIPSIFKLEKSLK